MTPDTTSNYIENIKYQKSFDKTVESTVKHSIFQKMLHARKIFFIALSGWSEYCASGNHLYNILPCLYC